MRIKTLNILTTCLLLSLLPLKAGQSIPLPIEQLSSESQLILHGTVTSQSVQRDPENRIFTKIDLQVEEVWKGSLATNHFTIVQGGGILGEQRMTVSGQVEYTVGEEVVAFLVINKRGEGVTIGLAQGKFHIFKDAVTGQKMAHNPFHGLSESDASASSAQTKSKAGSTADLKIPLAISDLKQLAVGGAK